MAAQLLKLLYLEFVDDTNREGRKISEGGLSIDQEQFALLKDMYQLYEVQMFECGCTVNCYCI